MAQLWNGTELGELDQFITEALADHAAENPAVAGIERISNDPPGWYVRFNGEAKENYSAELTLGQRSLRFETYFLPAPEENLESLYEHLLVRNTKLSGMAFAIRDDGGIYIEGRLPNRMVTEPGELDRILGSLYSYTENLFAPAAKIGFASRFQ